MSRLPPRSALSWDKEPANDSYTSRNQSNASRTCAWSSADGRLARVTLVAPDDEAAIRPTLSERGACARTDRLRYISHYDARSGQRKIRPHPPTPPFLSCCTSYQHQKFGASSRRVATRERTHPTDKQRPLPLLQLTYSTIAIHKQTSKRLKAS
ncbi:hypothetical protein EVAR_7654_1 [Eumeta japonica]|uniref:Uncharacterized protein n=1 Tax=Eumeta variegata TaxID=151549 RepID=A0A4C1TI54_EUMVA|nr:hypothetical protein EVAR_7654_1 [Eumeta japonica]